MRLRTAFVLIILCAVAVRAFPADLLQQEGSLRVVTGDWAVWATRGVEVTPEACSAPLPLLKAMLTQCGLSEKETAFADALAKGLNTRGWAQLEAEPEGGNLKLRVWATSGTPRTLVMERLDIEQGVTARATARLPDGPVEIQQPPRTEILDRSVYRSLLSPESFVLNQEHFQKQFFESMLDLGTPGMETVRAAYEGRKPGLALYELAEFFRRKTAPAALIRKPAESPTAKEDLAAEEVCRHLFKKGDQTVDLGPVINWTRNKTDDAEWLWSLNKHTQFLMLVEGYLKTGNEEYVDEFCAQICDWIIQNPAPPYVLTRVGAWRNLEAGGRCSTAWPPAFYGFLSSPRLTPHAIQLILASLWSHGDYLLKHPAGLRKPNNWSIIDSTGLTAVGVYFPELAGAAAWRDTGYERLSRQLAMQVYPDGFQYELAPGYHVFCLKNFDKAFMLARETGVTLPPDFAKRLETMYEALMWIAKPDRRAPMASDSSVLPLKDLLLEGAARFARDDFRWVATEGAEGRPPDGTSHALPYAGYFVMREDWSSAAQYLFFDGGPLGVSHSHEDKLSFELSAYGRAFIVDRGPYQYVPDKWRTFFIGTAAHSTILIDGLEQYRSPLLREHEAPDPPVPCWSSNAHFDVASATYDSGYGSEHLPVTHGRTVVYRKPGPGVSGNTSPSNTGYWVIIDELRGSGEHDVESLFQFAPGLSVTTSPDEDHWSVATTTMSDGPNLRLAVEARDRVRLSVISGQEDPRIQGWHSPAYGQRVEAPTLSCHAKCALPVTLTTILAPTRQGAPPALRTKTTESSPGEYVLEVRAGADGAEYIRIIRGTAEASWTTSLK